MEEATTSSSIRQRVVLSKTMNLRGRTSASYMPYTREDPTQPAITKQVESFRVKLELLSQFGASGQSNKSTILGICKIV